MKFKKVEIYFLALILFVGSLFILFPTPLKADICYWQDPCQHFLNCWMPLCPGQGDWDDTCCIPKHPI